MTLLSLPSPERRQPAGLRAKSISVRGATLLLLASIGCQKQRIKEVIVEVPVLAENAAPIARQDLAMVLANSPGTLLDLLANDEDPDGDHLYITDLGAPDHGGAVERVGDTAVYYAPATGFDGTEQFTYQVDDGRGGGAQASVTVRVTRVEAAFQLQLLHASDMESASGTLEDVPRFASVLTALRDQVPDHTLLVSAGNNYAASPLFSASNSEHMARLLGAGCGGKQNCSGRADIVLLNALGFQAAAFGNHEFDEGAARVAGLLLPGSSWEGTKFPYLAANLGFSTDPNLAGLVFPSAEPAQPNSIAGSATLTVGGETVGVVGATTPTLSKLAQADGVTVLPAPFGGSPSPTELLALAQIIQASVDELTKSGVDKIVLLASLKRLDIEQKLASLLQNVDIVVGGGANAILADATDRLREGDVATGPYPEVRYSSSGEPVLLLRTGGEWRYVGRLLVGFDAAGRILLESLDPSVSGSYATDGAGVDAVGGADADGSIGELVTGLREVLNERDGTVFGRTSVYLEGRDLATGTFGVRGQETNLGNLAADAQLFVARQSVPETSVALQNAGGIRSSIGVIAQRPGSADASDVLLLPPGPNAEVGKTEGDISAFDIQSALPFDDPLVVVRVSAAELRAILEYGVDLQPSRQARFPQIAGMTLSYDATQGSGARLQSLVISQNDEAIPPVKADVVVDEGEVVGDPGRSFLLVTNAFLQRGGDGYPFPAPRDCVYLVDEPARPEACEVVSDGADLVVTFFEAGRVQHALAAYLQKFYSGGVAFDQADTPIELDERIRSLAAH